MSDPDSLSIDKKLSISNEDEETSHEQFIDRGLLDLYKEQSHELFITQEMHEAIEREEETPVVSDIIRRILLELQAAIEGRFMMKEDRQWLSEWIEALHKKIDIGELRQHDIKVAITLVRDILFRLYPGKTISEIEKELDVETFEDSLQVERGETHESPEAREMRIKQVTLELYGARYGWGYYPELHELLELTDNKIENEKKIRAKEADFKSLIDAFLDSERARGREHSERRDYFQLIAKKMEKGEATLDEELQYKLEYNKLRMQWFTAFLPAFEDLVVHGGDDAFIRLWKDVWKLSKYAEWKREIITDEERREREEQLTALGRNPDEAASKEGVGKEEVDGGNRLIDEALIILYPEIVEIAEDGTRSVNQKKLEEILGIKKE